MAFQHGKNATFSLDNNAGTLTALSAYVTDVSFDRAVDTAETSVLNLDDKQYIPGMRGATMSVNGPWDAVVDAHFEPLLGKAATISFAYSPDGGTTTYSGECFVTSFASSSPVGGAGTWSSQLQITGAVTRS